jgi:YVTN family beta-propeller protein
VGADPGDNSVSRIDPATNQVVVTIPVGRAPGAVTEAGGVVWVALPEGGLGRIDPASNRSTVVRIPRCCAGELAAGEGALWVANREDGTLVRVDPATDRVAARVLLPRTTERHPHQVAVGGGAVWVTSASPRRDATNVLWRVDPASNQVTGTLDLGPTSAGAQRIPARAALPRRRRQQRHQHSPLGIGQIVTGRGRHRGHEASCSGVLALTPTAFLGRPHRGGFSHPHG